MKHEKALGILILADFVLAVCGFAAEHALRPFLPDPLRDYLAQGAAASSRPGHMALAGLWGLVIITTVLAWIGLLNLVRPARLLYLASWAGYILLLACSGPVVTSALTYAVQMMMAIVGGAILGLVYLSDLRTRFRALSQAAGASTPKAA